MTTEATTTTGVMTTEATTTTEMTMADNNSPGRLIARQRHVVRQAKSIQLEINQSIYSFINIQLLIAGSREDRMYASEGG